MAFGILCAYNNQLNIEQHSNEKNQKQKSMVEIEYTDVATM